MGKVALQFFDTIAFFSHLMFQSLNMDARFWSSLVVFETLFLYMFLLFFKSRLNLSMNFGDILHSVSMQCGGTKVHTHHTHYNQEVPIGICEDIRKASCMRLAHEGGRHRHHHHASRHQHRPDTNRLYLHGDVVLSTRATLIILP